MESTVSSRVERERQKYDEDGVKRGAYQDILVSHAGYMHGKQRAEITKAVLAGREIERALELGRVAWHRCFETNNIIPKELYCINISERELQKGAELSETTRIKPKFLLMDAHKLDFPDDHFDVVFGWGILHHLDLGLALAEIRRVLRPDGIFMFSEPLDNNPVGRLVRRATPGARTVDETPFRASHLAAIREQFDCEFHYEQMVSVPLGIVSRLIFSKPENALTRLAFRTDLALQRSLPGLGAYFRKVTIVGRPRGKSAPTAKPAAAA